MQETQDNSTHQASAAKVHKAVRAWKDLLLSLQEQSYTGMASITVPIDSGALGRYRTYVAEPKTDDS